MENEFQDQLSANKVHFMKAIGVFDIFTLPMVLITGLAWLFQSAPSCWTDILPVLNGDIYTWPALKNTALLLGKVMNMQSSTVAQREFLLHFHMTQETFFERFPLARQYICCTLLFLLSAWHFYVCCFCITTSSLSLQIICRSYLKLPENSSSSALCVFCFFFPNLRPCQLFENYWRIWKHVV